MLVTQLVEHNVEMALVLWRRPSTGSLSEGLSRGQSEYWQSSHCRLVDRRNEGTSAGGAATEGTQAEGGAELASEIDEIASHVR